MIEKGTRVFARFSDGAYYEGTVTLVLGRNIRVQFDDGDRADVGIDDIRILIGSNTVVAATVVGMLDDRLRSVSNMIGELSAAVASLSEKVSTEDDARKHLIGNIERLRRLLPNPDQTSGTRRSPQGTISDNKELGRRVLGHFEGG